MIKHPVKVGLVGLGTVGKGVLHILQNNCDELHRRLGRPIELIHVGARHGSDACEAAGIRVSCDIFQVAQDPEVDMLVELIGGTDTAKEIILQAIAQGKHIVTANKALIAEYGEEIFSAAVQQGAQVRFEAAVAGGIPIVQVLKQSLVANQIEWIAGIINGTTNYILTEMFQHESAFDEALAEAQQEGYAEAEPSFDIDGVDAAHKLTILASLAFGIPLNLAEIYIEGIRDITLQDLHYADSFGYRVKHLGIARRTAHGIEVRVHATLVPKDSLLANVSGVMNAVLVQGDAVGATLYYGAGAGSLPTASAVVADIMAVTNDIELGLPALAYATPVNSPILPMSKIKTAYYLRIEVQEQTGVLAHITKILSDHAISIKAVLQREINNGLVPIVMLTNEICEQAMELALTAIETLPEVVGKVVKIRLEHLDKA